EQLAAVRTPVWVIDDIHWAEQTLLDLIVYLLEQSQAPVLVLCSARHDLLEKHPEWGERPDSVRMLLKPLSDANAGQIVQNLLGKAGIAGAVRDRIVTAARSEEHTSELQSRGHLVCRLLLEKINTNTETVSDFHTALLAGVN